MSQSQRPESTIKVIPKVSAIKAGCDQYADFLIKIQGPDRPQNQERRLPLNLALVIDRSGSMAGQPLHEAKRCARTFISQLQAEDHVCIIAYDNRVKTLFDSQAIGDRDAVFEAINSIQPGGSTNLHQGWAAGFRALKENALKASISRVLLLSDGRANQGMTETGPISHECARATIDGISTSTYGLSHHFNEELMTAMAKHGQGQAYYGETAEDLMEPFQQEFDLLSSIYARKVRFHAPSEAGYRVEIMNAYLGAAEKVLPDLAYESEVWVLVRVHIPEHLSGLGQGEMLELGECHLSAIDLNGTPLPLPTAPLRLNSVMGEEYDAFQENTEVRRRILEIQAAHLHDAARLAAREGRWAEVDRLLEEVQTLAEDNPWLLAMVQTLKTMARRRDERRFSKESRYSSHYLSTRYSGRDESASMEDDSLESRSFTRRRSRQGKNSGGSTE